MNGIRILVVDDEKVNRTILKQRLNALGFTAEAFERGESALKALEAEAWDLMLTDLCMPSIDGMQLMALAKERRPELGVIIMTAFGDVKTAVEAMRKGAVDYLTKPFSFDELRIRLENWVAARPKNHPSIPLADRAAKDDFYGIVGVSPHIKGVIEVIERFANSDSEILIQGETGTGKELVARALHAFSNNANGPFVALGCGNIPRELAESELFGHEAGAFTGATRRRKGRIELAQGGTFFLDDIDDTPQELQGKLLRVIEDRKFERVGGEQTLTADVRFICSTKVPLAELVKSQQFRVDLLYRINTIVIKLAPLRERRDDIERLARHFIDAFSLRRGVAPKSIAADAVERLMAHSWPGNVRELKHAMEYAMQITDNSEIKRRDLPEDQVVEPPRRRSAKTGAKLRLGAQQPIP